ncbi:P27 family phage terminase small subunit [Pararhizobium sp. YC-54]|uniref:P27 family phage terminase small subunit n=1 Tax=Pararhizobium sp. YC-54 TaxID=2986920 RepID=UPI0021F704B2|nr:P27 family phage terminase small subunit [Pararhizobium sp. YC-54]MCV9997337.1 P27 family phage terminase small subunit [Pararhizobium sp. YC-54]
MTLSPVLGGDGVPPEPDWASIYTDEFDILEAHEQWTIVLNELREANTLAVSNGHAIKRLVEFRVQYDRSSKHVAEHGPVLKGKRAKVGQWNPHWSVMRQADEAIRVIEAELGIAPARRGKVTKVTRGKKTSRAADSYLKPVSG